MHVHVRGRVYPLKGGRLPRSDSSLTWERTCDLSSPTENSNSEVSRQNVGLDAAAMIFAVNECYIYFFLLRCSKSLSNTL